MLAGMKRASALVAIVSILLWPAFVRSVMAADVKMAGWTVKVSDRVTSDPASGWAVAEPLLRGQLEEVTRVVPKKALADLQKVTIWVSPEYPNTPPRAEYHPDAGWLRANGREPAMAKGVEITNVRIFAAETKRMPNFLLHELAHAYHDRVLGFDEAEILAAYEKARASKSYDSVKRDPGGNRPHTTERAYAMTDAKEYFAETTEAFFVKNDFFPFTRAELEKHDPGMAAVLRKMWGVE